MENHNTPKRSKDLGIGPALINFLLGLMTGIVILIIEYRTGLFQEVPTLGFPPLILRVALASNAFTFVCSIMFVLQSFAIWSRPYLHVREEFALPALMAWAFGTLTALISLFFQITPWYTIASVWLQLNHQVSSVPLLNFSDWIAVLALTAL